MPSIEDRVLVDLNRAAVSAGRPGISVPSLDLPLADAHTGSRQRTQQALLRLRFSGRLISVRKDLAVIPDATGRITVDLPELIHVVAPQPYLITGGKALQHDGLTDQHFFSAKVLVPTRVTNFEYHGERAEFLVTRPDRIWGWQRGVGAKHAKPGPQFATAERAIVDALSHSRYGVSFSQAVTALVMAAEKDPRFLQRLLTCVRRYDETATARRVGLIVDRLFGTENAEPYRELVGTWRSPTLLRPNGPTDAPFDTDWRVIVNASLVPEEAMV